MRRFRQHDDTLITMAATPEIEHAGGRGALTATIVSLPAPAFSAVSFYETVIRQADIAVHVAPVMHYGREPALNLEVLAVPVTITNEGAQGGTVLSLELIVHNPVKEDGWPDQRVYYSAYFGEHPREQNSTSRAFAPISLAGRSGFSDTIRFFPKGNPLPLMVRAEGTYRMTLRVTTAGPSEPTLIDRLFRAANPAPVTFERTLPWISDQHLRFRRGTIPMHAKNWQAVAAPQPNQ